VSEDLLNLVFHGFDLLTILVFGGVPLTWRNVARKLVVILNRTQWDLVPLGLMNLSTAHVLIVSIASLRSDVGELRRRPTC
jgi:hypothetical protein